MEDTDLLKKLLALALHNPSEEEARSAAMAACRLIQDRNITIGGERVTLPVNNWEKPSPEFEETWAEMQPKTQPNGEGRRDEFNAGEGLKTPIQDNDIDDDFMRKRVIKAWQMIREERANLYREIHMMETRFQTRYTPLYKEHKK